ncbi:MAG: hypothetical protein FWH44_04915 [Methanomassiliicoccaceae archaeon]|nr:hypothetical protein [Methanomassiliicoccaceae archaeon]
MRLNRKGVIDLPVRLMIVVLIVCISVPLLTAAVEHGESNNAALSMNKEADKIFNAAAAVHYSGEGSSRTVSVDIPGGCEMIIPGGSGSDGYSLHMIFKGKDVGVRYMDNPPIRFDTDRITITNSAMLLITAGVIDDVPVVRVSVV